MRNPHEKGNPPDHATPPARGPRPSPRTATTATTHHPAISGLRDLVGGAGQTITDQCAAGFPGFTWVELYDA
jgi:hypothetical protein